MTEQVLPYRKALHVFREAICRPYRGKERRLFPSPILPKAKGRFCSQCNAPSYPKTAFFRNRKAYPSSRPEHGCRWQVRYTDSRSAPSPPQRLSGAKASTSLRFRRSSSNRQRRNGYTKRPKARTIKGTRESEASAKRKIHAPDEERSIKRKRAAYEEHTKRRVRTLDEARTKSLFFYYTENT